jgi:menaquinone-dependent protoporphyrinogen oxidase
MRRILVAFASREGQTEKIAHHIARRLEDAGHLTRLIDLKAGETEAGADDCDAAILAGAIHRGHHEQALARFIMRHAPALRRGHSAFLSVSVSAGSHNRADLQAVDEVVQGFLYELGWHPDCIEHVAGAVREPLGDRPAAGLGMLGFALSAEPTRETELTDWAKLDAFIASFAAQMKGLRSA